MAEQVVAVGLLGLLLLVVAAMLVQTRRGGVQNRRMYEATCLSKDLLEKQLAKSVYDLPLGPQATISGQLQDKIIYGAVVEGYSLAGPGGLTDQDLKGIRVTVTWSDSLGAHSAKSEAILSRIPK